MEIRGDVVTFISNSFSVPGDQTDWYKAQRRMVALAMSIPNGLVFGVITATTFHGTITTVTVAPDAGALDASLSAVWLGVDPLAIDFTAALAGVDSFNTRTGAVILNSTDVNVALEYHGLRSLYYARFSTSAILAGTP
jgi:hypothetical protein